MTNSHVKTSTHLDYSRVTPKPVNISDLGSPSTPFRVPDDDEVDSSSASSREASVQILDSLVRRYSVPSSGDSISASDDEVEISSVKEAQLSKSTKTPSLVVDRPSKLAETTPHVDTETLLEIPSSKDLESNRPCEKSFVISSMTFTGNGTPLHTNDEAPLQKVVSSSDSEDEHPQLLSSKHTQMSFGTPLPASFGTPATDSHSLLDGPSGAKSRKLHWPYEAEQDRSLSRNERRWEKSRAESHAAYGELEIEDSYLIKSINDHIGDVDVIYSEDLDSSDHRSTCHVQESSSSANHALPPTACAHSRPLGAAPFNLFKDSSESFQTNLLARRPPSPSDAALVKRATDTQFTLSQNSHTDDCIPPIINLDTNPSMCGAVHRPPKENGSHPARLDISDIVHPPLEFARNLKRTADRMSIDELFEESYEESHILSSRSSQDVLTDAQPRGNAAAEAGFLEDSAAALPEDTVIVHQSPISDFREPPRKKVKTSVSAALGIGKFASGVCVGVMGLFATFIATIPLSVREEAMQELVNSA